jgi:hypothetical protein
VGGGIAAVAAAVLRLEEMGEVGEVLLLLLPPLHLHLKREGGVAAAVITVLELNKVGGHTVPIPFPSLSTLSQPSLLLLLHSHMYRKLIC